MEQHIAERLDEIYREKMGMLGGARKKKRASSKRATSKRATSKRAHSKKATSKRSHSKRASSKKSHSKRSRSKRGGSKHHCETCECDMMGYGVSAGVSAGYRRKRKVGSKSRRKTARSKSHKRMARSKSRRRGGVVAGYGTKKGSRKNDWLVFLKLFRKQLKKKGVYYKYTQPEIVQMASKKYANY